MVLKNRLIKAHIAFNKCSHYYVSVDTYITARNGIILIRENTRPNLMAYSYPYYLVTDDGKVTGRFQLPLTERMKPHRKIPDRYQEKYLNQEINPHSLRNIRHKYWYAVGDNKHLSEDWGYEGSDAVNKKIFSKLRKLGIEYFVTQVQGLRFISIHCNSIAAEQLKMNLGDEYFVNRMSTLSVEMVKRARKIMHYHPIMGMFHMEKSDCEEEIL